MNVIVDVFACSSQIYFTFFLFTLKTCSFVYCFSYLCVFYILFFLFSFPFPIPSVLLVPSLDSTSPPLFGDFDKSLLTVTFLSFYSCPTQFPASRRIHRQQTIHETIFIFFPSFFCLNTSTHLTTRQLTSHRNHVLHDAIPGCPSDQPQPHLVAPFPRAPHSTP